MPIVDTPGRFPQATWAGSPNHWPGHRARKAVVIHINEGGFESSIAYMLRMGTSAHFEVGRDGRLVQMVNVQDSAWCNGLSFNPAQQRWVCPHGYMVTPTWELIDPSDINPNLVTLSIENEGFSGRPWPAAQFAANVGLLVWLGGQFPELLPYTVGRTLIAHAHLDPRDKARCPGSGVSLVALAEAANAALAGGGPGAAWRLAWGARGVPLPEAQVGWAIPQLYKLHAAELGACLLAETYLIPGFSIALFERGFIYYVQALNQAYVRMPMPLGQ